MPETKFIGITSEVGLDGVAGSIGLSSNQDEFNFIYQLSLSGLIGEVYQFCYFVGGDDITPQNYSALIFGNCSAIKNDYLKGGDEPDQGTLYWLSRIGNDGWIVRYYIFAYGFDQF